MTIRQSVRVLPFGWFRQSDAVGGFQDASRNPLANEGHSRDVVSQLINGQDAIADHLGFGGHKVGKDESRAVT